MQFGAMSGGVEVGSIMVPAGAAPRQGAGFALHPPRTGHGLDPTRRDLFGERLEELRRRADPRRGQPAESCLQLVDLEQIRLRFGRRWTELREKAFQYVEHALARGLGEHDLYLVASEDRIYLLCTGLPREEAELRARLIAAAVTERLCGAAPGGVAVRVRTLPGGLDALLAGVTGPGLLEERIEAALGDAERLELESLGTVRAAMAAAWQPVLAPARGMVGAYRLEPVLPDGSLDRRRPASASEMFDMEVDHWAVETAAAALPATAARGRKALLVVPVHYATLAAIRLREPYCRACRQLPRNSARRLLFEVQDLPAGIVQARLRELMAYLRPFCAGILMRLPLPDAGHLAETGIAGVTLLDPDGSHGPDFAASARRYGLRSFLFGVSSPAACQRALRSGIDYLAGDGFMPALSRPGPAVLRGTAALPGR